MLSYTTPLMFFPNKSGGNSKDLSLQSTVLHVTFAIGHSGDTVKPKQTFFFVLFRLPGLKNTRLSGILILFTVFLKTVSEQANEGSSKVSYARRNHFHLISD